MLTKLERIAEIAKEKPKEKFTSLMHLIDEKMPTRILKIIMVQNRLLSIFLDLLTALVIVKMEALELRERQVQRSSEVA